MRQFIVLWVFGLTVVLAGCAGQRQVPDLLIEARAEVDDMQGQALVAEAAPDASAAAEDELARAEQLFEDGKEIDLVKHHSYLARQHARVAMAGVENRIAEQKIENADRRRNEILLRSREIEAAQARVQAERAEREAARESAAAKRAREAAEQAQRNAEELAQQLKELKAERTERGLVLTLSDVLFDTNESELKPGAFPTIERLANFLNERTEQRIRVEGHTDARGDAQYNMSLSQRRAESVKAALVNQGVDPARVVAEGRGEDFPVASNDSSAGRQQNRRVEIVVQDS